MSLAYRLLAARINMAASLLAAPLTAQQAMLTGPLGISHSRLGSGTSWLPEASPMRAYHWSTKQWSLMLHGDIDLLYDTQGGPRGDTRVVSTSWLMLMAMHPVGNSLLHLHAMASAEPFTVGGEGYPLLLQTGESNNGAPLKDHQHPHDLFMELAAMYEAPLSHRVALSLYAAPVGEPAMGPVAFMHRASAQNMPVAPIGHHWQDATHITFGVLTAGVYSHAVKLEGSFFNGREPDEHRTDFDFHRFDSWSARLSWNPSPSWSTSTSYGYLKSPEATEPDRWQERISASAQHTTSLGATGEAALGLIFGANHDRGQSGFAPSLALEANLELNDRHTVFGRAEMVEKNAEELVLENVPAGRRYGVGALTAGYIRELVQDRRTTLGLGITGTVNLVPESLRSTYGSRTPLGLVLYLRLRPAVMRGHGDMAGMVM